MKKVLSLVLAVVLVLGMGVTAFAATGAFDGPASFTVAFGTPTATGVPVTFTLNTAQQNTTVTADITAAPAELNASGLSVTFAAGEDAKMITVPYATSAPAGLVNVAASDFELTDAAGTPVAIDNTNTSNFTIPAVITITTQPAATASYAVGATAANLTVAASTNEGGATLAYQWYVNGSAISGANAATLTAANIDTSTAGTFTYYCAVSGGAATTVNSSNAVITVNTASVFNAGTLSASPSATVTAGKDLVLTVAGASPATGGTLSYTFTVNGTTYSAQAGNSFTYTTVDPTDIGTLTASCTVSDGVGNNASAGSVSVVVVPEGNRVASNWKIVGVAPAWRVDLSSVSAATAPGSAQADKAYYLGVPDPAQASKNAPSGSDKFSVKFIAGMFEWEKPDGSIKTFTETDPEYFTPLRSTHFKNIGLRKSNTKGNNVIKSAEIKEADSKFELKFVDYYTKTSSTDVEAEYTITIKGKASDLTFGFTTSMENEEELIEEDQDECTSYGNIYMKADATVRNVEFEGEDSSTVWATKTVVKGQKYYFNVTTDLATADENLIATTPEIDSIYTVYQTNMSNATIEFRDLDQEYFVYDQDGKLLGTTKDKALPLAQKYILTTAKVDFGTGGVEETPSESEAPAPDPETPPSGGGVVEGGNTGYNPNTGL